MLAASPARGSRIAGKGWILCSVSQFTVMFQDLVKVETFLCNSVEDRLLSDFQLPFGRFQVLQVVSRRGSCRVGDIAEELAITWGGTSKLVDRLEATSLCRRRPNPDDKRSSLITLTPAGERLLVKAQGVADDELREIVGPLTTTPVLTQLASALAELRMGIDGDLQDQTG